MSSYLGITSIEWGLELYLGLQRFSIPLVRHTTRRITNRCWPLKSGSGYEEYEQESFNCQLGKLLILIRKLTVILNKHFGINSTNFKYHHKKFKGFQYKYLIDIESFISKGSDGPLTSSPPKRFLQYRVQAMGDLFWHLELVGLSVLFSRWGDNIVTSVTGEWVFFHVVPHFSISICVVFQND